jgi:hypothetical protein
MLVHVNQIRTMNTPTALAPIRTALAKNNLNDARQSLARIDTTEARCVIDQPPPAQAALAFWGGLHGARIQNGRGRLGVSLQSQMHPMG